MKLVKPLATLGMASVILLSASNIAFADTTSTASFTLKASEGGESGAATIDEISAIEFGEKTLSDKEETYTAINPLLMKVSDTRGTGEGWALNAKITKFVKENDTSVELRGSVLTIAQGEVTSPSGSASEKPTAAKNVVLNDEEHTLFAGRRDQGLGTWLNTVSASGVTLKVPNGNKAGKYTATISYVLAAAPQS